MLKKTLQLAVPAALLCAGLAAPRAMAQPAPAAVQQTVSVTATVESVDMTTRQVLLSGPKGGLVTVVAGKGVQNLGKLKAGDHVVITEQRAVAVQVGKPGQDLAAPTLQGAAVRAARGELPAGAAYELVNVNVRVNKVDAKTHTVSFTRADGSTGEITVKNPDLQKFADQLKPGDNVELAYLQAVSIVAQKP